jgi:hypothetical protein
MLWRKIKALFGKKAVLDLDNDGKIESYKQEIEGVFAQFKRMDSKLDEVITKLQDVAEDEEYLRIQAEKRVEKALSEIEMNKKLKEKLKDFIV